MAESFSPEKDVHSRLKCPVAPNAEAPGSQHPGESAVSQHLKGS